MESEKYTAAKIALRYARSDSLGSKSDMERHIKKMKRASSMPADVLENYIKEVYKDNESDRVKGYFGVALKYAGGDSIIDNYQVRDWLEYAQEHSDNPLDKKVVDNVWNVYNQNNPRRKYGCLKVALRNAGGDSITDKSTVKSWLESAQEYSNMPLSQKVADKIWAVYQENESKRAKRCLEVALRNARGDSITDKSTVKNWLESAQEHSDTPLSQDVISNIWDIYKENEPKRAEECFKVALKYANKGGETEMESWLKYAQEHSHGFFANIRSKIREFLIRRKFDSVQNSKPIPSEAYDLV